MIDETTYKNNPLTKERDKQIDKLLEQFDNNNTPGCSVGVIQNGVFIYKKSFGMANLEYDISITSDSVFDLCSITKQFTATGIALLHIAGKLNLGDKVIKYIPEIPEFMNSITIRHLIFHTSGLKDYYSLMEISGENFDEGQCYFNNADLLKRVKRMQNLNFDPGTDYQYSNTGYLLLAEIIERIYENTFARFIDERIFKPLGMKCSLINDSWYEIIKNRVISYDLADGKYCSYTKICEDVGAAGLFTTINNFLLWEQNFYHWKVGGKKLQKLFAEERIFRNEEKTEQYGLGLIFYKYKGINAVSHNGSARAFNAQMRQFPDQNTTILVFCNNDYSAALLTERISDIIFADIIKSNELDEKQADYDINNRAIQDKIEPPSIECMNKYTGKFYSEELDISYEIKSDNNTLSIYVKDRKIAIAEIVKDNIFMIDEWDATLIFTENDHVSSNRFTLDTGRAQHITFEKLN